MAEQATILIPDISGFTDFISKTELDHSSHIINELLDLIVESNEQDFTLSEIEGDAVLFYRKGKPLDQHSLIGQCLTIFQNFHGRLKIIERDTVCQCGACQGITNLTLKFIVHQGLIKEIKVAQFVKAAGIDMITAHRLLKNNINAHEYILISEPCINCIEMNGTPASLSWEKGKENYSAIGDVAFHYAVLSDFRKALPELPERKRFVVERGPDNLEVRIERPLKTVYNTLVNVDERLNWMLGVDKINRDPISERVGMQHNCQFMGMTMINTAEYSDFRNTSAVYVERVEVSEMGLDTLDTWDLTPIGDSATHLNFNINWLETPLPPEVKQGMLQAIMQNIEALKNYCEGNPE